ncbi:chorismate--pyruvate lyase family protein [Motilimonas pumila]|uniref:chorismate--pyruvate lyase family protein n=1 Tax=Motilimonas pumila TaxID=2303987 RepID=UPI001314681E|nr:chorismate lyase [Motilimonas pumila]
MLYDITHVNEEIKKLRFPLGCRSDWHPVPQVQILSDGLTSWLSETGSLTARLQQHCKRFVVQVIGQEEVPADKHEIQVLGNDNNGFIIREVLLWCDDQPWVYARTVIPKTTITNLGQEIEHLGDRPLGAFLFNTEGMTRGVIEVAEFQPGSALFSFAQAISPLPIANIWGRRSVFKISNNALLVQEVFLPAAQAYR